MPNGRVAPITRQVCAPRTEWRYSLAVIRSMRRQVWITNGGLSEVDVEEDAEHCAQGKEQEGGIHGNGEVLKILVQSGRVGQRNRGQWHLQRSRSENAHGRAVVVDFRTLLRGQQPLQHQAPTLSTLHGHDWNDNDTSSSTCSVEDFALEQPLVKRKRPMCKTSLVVALHMDQVLAAFRSHCVLHRARARQSEVAVIPVVDREHWFHRQVLCASAFAGDDVCDVSKKVLKKSLR